MADYIIEELKRALLNACDTGRAYNQAGGADGVKIAVLCKGRASLNLFRPLLTSNDVRQCI